MCRRIKKAGTTVDHMLRLFLALTLALTSLLGMVTPFKAEADESGSSEETEYEFHDVASEEEAAVLLWSACKGYGMPNQNIAAILGCLSCISSLDPGKIELVSEEFTQADSGSLLSAEGLSCYAEHQVFSFYQALYDLRSCLGEEYLAEDGSYYPGVGIAMWKGNHALDFLEQAGFLCDGKWNTIDYNTVYLLQSDFLLDDQNSYEMLCQWKANNLSVEEAVSLFAAQWLGYGSDHDLSLQIEKACLYKEAMNQWEYDDTFAQNIQVLVNRLDHHRVIDTFYYDNSTPALAAVSISHRYYGEGYYDYGTELYRTVRDNVDDPWVIYQSCDRLIGTAMRWSGADIDFPMGNVLAQYNHVKNSDQWELIAVGNEISRDDLEPGDIFICLGNVGHIWMYVGQDAIRSIYGDDFSPEDADSVCAGYQRFSPMVGDFFDLYINIKHGYEENIDRETGTYYSPSQYVPYYQFRLVYSDESDLYKDAADKDPLRWPR